MDIKLMPGLDNLLASSLESTIRNNLGDKAVKKIEKRVFERYGMSLTESIIEFNKIDSVLREFFGAGADGLETKFLENICSVKSKSKSNNWVIIQNDEVNKIILESFGDDDKAKILNDLVNEPKIIQDVLSDCKIPQTSGYRKINELIKDGLLASNGIYEGKDGKKIQKYRSLFDNLKINIIKNKITVEVQLNKPVFSESTILQVVCET